MQVFSTDDVPSKDRFAYWRDVLTQHFIHLRPEPAGQDEFSSSITAQGLGGHSFSRVMAGGQRIHRTRSEIARSPHDLVFLNLQIRGNSSYRQDGEETALSPGDLFIIDAVRPFELGCAEPLAQISLKVPRPLLCERLRSPDNVAGAFVSRTSYAGRLLGSYVGTLWRDGQSDLLADSPHAVDHLMSLTAYDINRRHGDTALPRPAVRAGLYARAKSYIEFKASSRDLAPRAVAAAMAVSLRTLQAIFAENGNSISRQIQKARVALAARHLSDPAWRHRKIGEIAFMAGFSELSHFTHSFVRTHGETPGAWRRRALELNG